MESNVVSKLGLGIPIFVSKLGLSGATEALEQLVGEKVGTTYTVVGLISEMGYGIFGTIGSALTHRWPVADSSFPHYLRHDLGTVFSRIPSL